MPRAASMPCPASIPMTHHTKRYVAGFAGPTQASGSGGPAHGTPDVAAAPVPGSAVPCCSDRAKAVSMSNATKLNNARPRAPQVQAICQLQLG